MAANPAFTALKYDIQATWSNPQPVTAPVWTEQHGSGASVDTLRDSVTYDGWGRVLSWVQRKNGGIGLGFLYQFDRADNVTANAYSTMIYDATTDRLLRWSYSWGDSTTYVYDRAGNQITATATGACVWNYRYNALNQLVAAYCGTTLIARYAYDVVGRRIAKRVYSSSYKGGTVGYLRFVYDGANIAFEADSMGAVGLRFTWGGVDDLLAVDDGTNHYYVVQDLLRSVRGFVRRDGTWVVSHRSDPYGAALARDVNPGVPIPNVRHTWTSREYDAEIGWFYFRSRYYDPSHYRFVQEDPIGHAGGGNLYVYAAGNPLAGRDPSGLLVEESLTTYGIVRGSDDPGGGGGGDPWGQEDDYDRRWDWSHPRGEAHFITFCFSGECTSETRYLQPGAAATCPGPACPSVSQLISNKAFMRQVRTFFDVSQRIGKEVGAYFVADANGSVSVGRSGVGVQGGFDFSTLGPAPRNTFAEFHTHHDEPRGGGVPGGEPNSSDWPSRNDIYSIVMNRSYIWFITPWAPPGQVFKWH